MHFFKVDKPTLSVEKKIGEVERFRIVIYKSKFLKYSDL